MASITASTMVTIMAIIIVNSHLTSPLKEQRRHQQGIMNVRKQPIIRLHKEKEAELRQEVLVQ